MAEHIDRDLATKHKASIDSLGGKEDSPLENGISPGLRVTETKNGI